MGRPAGETTCGQIHSQENRQKSHGDRRVKQRKLVAERPELRTRRQMTGLYRWTNTPRPQKPKATNRAQAIRSTCRQCQAIFRSRPPPGQRLYRKPLRPRQALHCQQARDGNQAEGQR